MIEGLDGLMNKLSKIQSEEAIIQGLSKAAAAVEKTARQLSPVDDGSLRASITHEVDAAALSASIGTPLSYAPYVEFGTGIHSSEGTGRQEPWTYQDEEGEWHTTAGQHPQPFLYPSLVKNENKIKKEISDAIRKEMRGGKP